MIKQKHFLKEKKDCLLANDFSTIYELKKKVINISKYFFDTSFA